MLVIRLARRGRKKQAFYDVVLAEKARAVQKKYIKKFGYYNPLVEDLKSALVIDTKAIVKYLKEGAQPSQTLARLLVKLGVKEAESFIIKRHTKPKKEASKEEVPKEEVPKEETPTPDVVEAPEEAKKDDSVATELESAAAEDLPKEA